MHGGLGAPPNEEHAAGNAATETASLSMKGTIDALKEFGSENTKSVEEIMLGGSRSILATGTLLNKMVGALSSTVATTNEYLASGTNHVNKYLEKVPILGTISSGLNEVMTEYTRTSNEMLAHGRMSRKKMFNNFLQKLNNSKAARGSSAAAGSSAADTNSAPAAAATTKK